MKTRKMAGQIATASRPSTSEPALPTFADHLQELKGRLFWIAVAFTVASAAAYPFFGTIVHVLTKPIGDQKLYYMTPGGGLAFILKVCMYVGVIAILPVLVYHLYKFVAPVMTKNRARSVVRYTTASVVLALGGIAFAYFVTLPAAIQFLTNINIDQVSSMITIDSYMSFVIGYVIAGAILFQLPLIMLMINSITPLPPGKLMSFQRHMIVASFVVAAIVSPTPDVVNQTILAAPMVVMYQLGIVAVWLRNRNRHHHLKTSTRVAKAAQPVAQPSLATVPVAAMPVVQAPAPTPARPTSAGKVMDMIGSPTRHQSASAPVITATRAVTRPGSMDGMRSRTSGRPTFVRPQLSVPARHVMGSAQESRAVPHQAAHGSIPTI